MLAHNNYLESMTDELTKTPPTRVETFSLAHEMENMLLERHFQKTMKERAPSKLLEVFQYLNRDDFNHTERLKSYISLKGIE
ncbi:hypothetical protein ACFL35_04010 [Candidatus Riflebacteria bacterium]